MMWSRACRDRQEFRRALELIDAEDDECVRTWLLAVVGMIGVTKGIDIWDDDFVDEAMKRNREAILAIPMVRQNREEGREEGRKEGIALAQRANILRIAAKGNPPDGLEDLVAATQPEELDGLFELVDDARTTGDWSAVADMCEEAKAPNDGNSPRHGR